MHSCATSPPARIQHRVVRREALRDVVRVEDRGFRRGGQVLRTHHRDVHPRDRQDRRRAVRRGRYRADAIFLTRVAGRTLVRQELREVRADRDRTDARAATAVRDAEGLVQVQVRHVAAELARRGQADHRVHVRAVDVHLAAVRMDDLADLADVLLEHAVRRRVRDHDCSEVLRVRVGLRLQIGDVDVALCIACHDHDLHAGHVRGCRVRAVGGRRDQAHVAMGFAARCVVGVNDQQARVLALRPAFGCSDTAA